MTDVVNLFPGELGAINNTYTQIFSAGDLSANLASSSYTINQFPGFSIHLQASAGATGQFFVQGSNVPTPGTNDWVTILFFDGAGSAVTFPISGSATQFLINAKDVYFLNTRVIYTFTSGTGTVNAWLVVKG